MKWWLLLRQFPKFVFVAGIILGSTVLFALWWFTRPRAVTPSMARDLTAERAEIAKQAAKAEARIDYLFLADDDLYDAETGECLFKNWLHGDHPNALFYDQQNKRLFGEYPQGCASYAFDGTRTAIMMLPLTPPAITPSRKKIVFAKNKNVWTADIDWQNFKFVNERQVTTIDSFYEQNFAENVQLLTDKTLVVRSINNLLHVDLETGNVKPMRLPLGDIGKRRSPDSKWVTGVQNGQFYCYDVDANDAKTMPVGRTSFSDFQWLGNDKCLALSDKTVASFDRIANTLTEVVILPFTCFRIGEPSPDGQFIFCAGGMNAKNRVLVDLKKKTVAYVNGGAGIAWIDNDTFMFSREVPDSDLRGTWLRTMGQSERRVLPQPYVMTAAYPQLLVLPPLNGLIVFEIRKRLLRMQRKVEQPHQLLDLAHLLTRLMAIQKWKAD